MHHFSRSKTSRSLSLLAVVSAGAALLAACGGGGGGGPTGPSPYAGTYSGTVAVTAGPDIGLQRSYNITIDTSGHLNSTATDASGNVGVLTGSVDGGSGNFNVSGKYNNTSLVSGAGTLTQQNGTVTGAGTFQAINGDRGTIQLTRTSA